MLKTSKNCVESAASFLGRVVIAKKNIRETLDIYFLSIQNTAIPPYTQTKFTGNATILCLFLLKGRVQQQQLPSKVGLCCDRLQFFHKGVLWLQEK